MAELSSESIRNLYEEKDFVINFSKKVIDPDDLALSKDLKVAYYFFIPVSLIYYIISLILLFIFMGAI